MRIYLVVVEVDGRSKYRYFHNSKLADDFFVNNAGTVIIPIDFNAKKLATFLNKQQGV